MNNLEVAKLLKKVAAAYTVKGENFFKIAAYEKAADAVEHATSEVKDLWEDGKLDTVAGLGEHIRGYLAELFSKGKVEHFQKVMEGLPAGMFEILDVPGIGPKTAYKICSSIKIDSISDLKKAAASGKLGKIPGFGAKTAGEILAGIEELSRREGRMLLPYAWQIAEGLTRELKRSNDVKEVYPLGSLRRMVVTVGDIDIAASSENPAKVVKFFVKLPQVERVTGEGEYKATVVLRNGRQADFMVTEPERFGSLLQHLTGSAMHNIHLRKIANQKGLSLSEYGISKIHQEGDQFSQDLLAKCRTEEEFYKILDMDYIPPELREDTGEIEAAISAKLPKLVEPGQIRGDLHLHSNFPIETSHDLGADSLEDLAAKAKRLGYEYIAITDHNPSVSGHTPSEIKALLERRKSNIEQINSSRGIKLLSSLEVDIIVDGKLAVPNEILAKLDFVVASVHSSFNQPKGEMTRRILSAVKNPNVDVIGHPTGRLINSRESYEVDWQGIFSACKTEHKALEINSWPERLDLPDTLVREGAKSGVKFVISTDSHAVEHMDNMRFGVAVARRGWAQEKDILNTLSWLEFKKWFRIK